jgi:chaperone modulatory protein CbpM
MDDREFRVSLEIEVTTLNVWIEQGWLAPETTDRGQLFSDADVARGRLILDLIETMGVNDAGVDVIMDLLDQIHGLRATLRDLVAAVEDQGTDVKLRILADMEERKRG